MYQKGSAQSQGDNSNGNVSVPEIFKNFSHFNGLEIPSTYSGDDLLLAEMLQRNIDMLKILIQPGETSDERREMLVIAFREVYSTIDAYTNGIYTGLCDKMIQRAPFGKLRDQVENIIEDSFNACFLVSLCAFLNQSTYAYCKDKSKNVQYISEREFVYYHSPYRYCDPKSKDYFNIRYKTPDGDPEVMRKDYQALRKHRERLLKNREVYLTSKGSPGINEFEEHEWELFLIFRHKDKLDAEYIDKGDIIQDTFKRIGNLNNIFEDFENAFKDEKNSSASYKSYLSKMHKLDYKKVMYLYSFLLDYIKNNQKCSGMDLYRFERQFRLYGITSEMTCLMNCKNEKEERDVLNRITLLHNIRFSKIYEHYFRHKYLVDLPILVSSFNDMMHFAVVSSLLTLDALIQAGNLGDTWKQDFCDMINELAPEVFYDPDQIVYPIGPKAQKAFEKVIAIPSMTHNEFKRYNPGSVES